MHIFVHNHLKFEFQQLCILGYRGSNDTEYHWCQYLFRDSYLLADFSTDVNQGEMDKNPRVLLWLSQEYDFVSDMLTDQWDINSNAWEKFFCTHCGCMWHEMHTILVAICSQRWGASVMIFVCDDLIDRSYNVNFECNARQGKAMRCNIMHCTINILSIGFVDMQRDTIPDDWVYLYINMCTVCIIL